MGAYFTTSHVTSFLPGIEITASTPVITTTNLDAQIDGIEDEVDGALSQGGYPTPLTASESIEWVRRICLYGAAWWVYSTIPNQNDSVAKNAKTYHDLYHGWLEMIRQGKATVPGTGGEDGAPSDAPSGVFASTWTREDPATAWVDRDTRL